MRAGGLVVHVGGADGSVFGGLGKKEEYFRGGSDRD
jgi:hypothetical protein